MIEALESLTEGTFSKKLKDFVSVLNVIICNALVVSILVIIAVVKLIQRGAFYFSIALPNVVDFFVVKDFSLFIVS